MLSNKNLTDNSSRQGQIPAYTPDLPLEAASYEHNAELTNVRPPLNSCNDAREVTY